MEALRQEPELLAVRQATYLAHALVVPSDEPREQERQDAEVELVAMSVAQAFEASAGAMVYDVHTPQLARAAGLPDNPGFDLLSKRRSERRGSRSKAAPGSGTLKSPPMNGPRPVT